MARAVAPAVATKAKQQLSAAANRWMDAQMAFIKARLAFDTLRYNNLNAEEEARAAMNSARLAASAVMDAYYKTVNEMQATVKLASAADDLRANAR